jgi:hypothetical protein
MSIVTLKRKSQAQYRNISHTPDGFSLNGTHRSQGFVGQTSLSRSFPRTIMKGSTAKGSGGCCGKYPQGNIIQSGVNSLEDIHIVKKSVLSTHGLIDTKYRWIRRPKPYATVKPDTRINSQNEYIYYITQKRLKETRNNDGVTPCRDAVDPNPVYKKCTTLEKGQISDLCPQSKITKTPEYTGAISSNEHIFKLHEKCVFHDDFHTRSIFKRAPITCTRGAEVV